MSLDNASNETCRRFPLCLLNYLEVVYTPFSNINLFVISDFITEDIIALTDDDVILGNKTLKILVY